MKQRPSQHNIDGSLMMQRSSQDNGDGGLMTQRPSQDNRGYSFIMQRSSKDDGDGRLMMQRPSQENKDGSLIMQRTSQDNRNGSLMMRRTSKDNGDGSPIMQRTSQDYRDENLMMQRLSQDNEDDSFTPRFSPDLNMVSRISEDNGDGSFVARFSRDNGDGNLMPRFSQISGDDSLVPQFSQDNPDGSFVPQFSQDDVHRGIMPRFSQDEEDRKFVPRFSQDDVRDGSFMRRFSEVDGEGSFAPGFSQDNGNGSFAPQFSQNDGDVSFMPLSAKDNGGGSLISNDNDNGRLNTESFSNNAGQSLMKDSARGSARQSFMQRSSQDNADGTTMHRSFQDNGDGSLAQRFSLNQNVMNRSPRGSVRQSFVQRSSLANRDENLMQSSSQDIGQQSSLNMAQQSFMKRSSQDNARKSLMQRSSMDGGHQRLIQKSFKEGADRSLMQRSSEENGDEIVMQHLSSDSGFQNISQRSSQMSGRQSLLQPSQYPENVRQSLVSPDGGYQNLELPSSSSSSPSASSSSSYQINGSQNLGSPESERESFRQQSSQESARQSMGNSRYQDDGHIQDFLRRSSVERQFNENEQQRLMEESFSEQDFFIENGSQSIMQELIPEQEFSMKNGRKSLMQNSSQGSERQSLMQGSSQESGRQSLIQQISQETDRQSLMQQDAISVGALPRDSSQVNRKENLPGQDSKNFHLSSRPSSWESKGSTLQEEIIYPMSSSRSSFLENDRQGLEQEELKLRDPLLSEETDSKTLNQQGFGHSRTPSRQSHHSVGGEDEGKMQYRDASEVDEQNNEVVSNQIAAQYRSGRKSLVQEFIYPTSRDSFRNSISPTDEGIDQSAAISEEINHRRSSLRFFSRMSINSPENDLTKLQSQELMYSPSFARAPSQQRFELETNKAKLQNIQKIPNAADFSASRRQSLQKNLTHEHGHGEIHQEDFPTPASAAKSNDQDLDEEADEDMQPNMESGHGVQQCENSGGKISNEEYMGRSFGVKDQYEDHKAVHSSCAKGPFEPMFEVESDDDDGGMEEIEYRPSTTSAGEIYDEDHDGALAETEDDASTNEDKSGLARGQHTIQPGDKLQSKSFINLEGSMGSFRRGFGSSKSFIKVPFGASELSYEGFAKAHFVEPTVGIWPILWKTVTMQDLIRFSKDLITQPLLQRLAAAPHKQHAVFAFTHLLAYMGDIPTEQDVVYHIQQILMLGITCSDLRDEIFCQICKQTTANPSRWSNSRGWQAMALCVGTFAPSSTFRPFLEAHLEQVAGHFVGEWAGDTMSYQEEGMSNPSKAAEYCLRRLHKLAQAGARRVPPLHVEINAIEKMESVRVNMYLPDDTFKVLNLDPMATAGEVTEQLVQMNGLSDPKYYGIFQVLYADVMVEKVLTRNTYIMEVLSEWNKASLPPLEADTRFIAKAKRIFEKHILCLPNRNMMMLEDHHLHSGFAVQMDPSRTEMLFKRKIFIEDISMFPEDVQKAVENFDYVQTVRDVVYGVYPLEEHDAVMLGALQLRADSEFFKNLDDDLTDEIIRKFGPKIYVEGSEREWKTALLRTAAALPREEDTSNCISDYIDFLRSRCSLYGSCWFYVQQKSDPRLPHEMFVCINTAGVYFVKVKTKEQLLHMQFTEICSWGYSAFSFSLVTGNMAQK